MPKASIIIAFYKNIPFLELVLNGFDRQSNSDFEVIIAEDDNSAETINFLKRSKYGFEIQHVFQEDLGFRKCKILNKAVLSATSEYLIFIDGDCIPHRHFIKAYLKNAHLECCFGRRVMLGGNHTTKLLHGKASLKMSDLFKYASKQVKHSLYFPNRKPTVPKGKGIWGCNWGIKKILLLRINGFDEDYEKAGVGEDVDVEWRLRKSGVQLYYAKHNAIVYHLYHDSHYTETIVQANMLLLKRKQSLGDFYCSNGLVKG